MAQKPRPARFSQWFRRREVPEQIVVEVRFDEEAGVYYVAKSTLKGLHVEADTLDDMQREIASAVAELLVGRRDRQRPVGAITMKSAVPCVA